MPHPRRRGLWPALPLLGLILLPAGVGAQDADGWITAAEAYRRPHRPDSALAILSRGLDVEPGTYALLWRAAREAVSSAMLAEGEARARGFATAVELGRRAVAVRPEGTEGRAWLAAALGRHALDQGARTRVQMANEIYRLATAVVEVEPTNGVAQHVLGQWHAEVLRANRLTRFLARSLLGGDTFSQASWDEAVAHLEASVRAEPWALIHGLELARVYHEVGRSDEARRELERILALPDSEATDPQHRDRAERLLGEMR